MPPPVVGFTCPAAVPTTSNLSAKVFGNGLRGIPPRSTSTSAEAIFPCAARDERSFLR